MGDGSDERVSGVLPRTHTILRAIASTGRIGIRLKDLAERTGISRPTVHRLLQDLAEIGFVAQLDSRRYVLGQELFWLGTAAPFAMPQLADIQAIADDLAALTRDTVYVAKREAGGARYLLRVEGDYPLQARIVHPGELKTFTSSYSGLSLLAGLPDEVQEEAFRRSAHDGVEYAHPAAHRENLLRTAVRDVRERGWCTGADIMRAGLSGISAPVPGENGAVPTFAVAVSAADIRLTPERAARMAPDLLATADRIAAALAR